MRFRAGCKKSPTCRVDEWRACPLARLAEREQDTPRGEVPPREGQVQGGGVWGIKTACGQAHGFGVRVVKGESERKNKPCVCVRKELPEEFLKPL